MARTNTYDHFCPVARSLEVIGEKWSLLVVRELLNGPRRFTDLERGLPRITPKWLTARLRELEAAGLVERDTEPGRREVYYRLTPRGRDLQPVIAALNVWGTRHAIRPALPDEAIDPRRLALSVAGYLNATSVTAPEGTAWRVVFDGVAQELRFEAGRWRHRPGSDAALEVTTSMRGWSAMLSQAPDRPSPASVLEARGHPDERRRFFAVLEDILSAGAGAPD